jgi:hypothetical protein
LHDVSALPPKPAHLFHDNVHTPSAAWRGGSQRTSAGSPYDNFSGKLSIIFKRKVESVCASRSLGSHAIEPLVQQPVCHLEKEFSLVKCASIAFRVCGIGELFMGCVSTDSSGQLLSAPTAAMVNVGLFSNIRAAVLHVVYKIAHRSSSLRSRNAHAFLRRIAGWSLSEQMLSPFMT